MPCLLLEPQSPSPQGIVFDFDGVIVNTEPLHLQATRDALSRHGIELSDEEYPRRRFAATEFGPASRMRSWFSAPSCEPFVAAGRSDLTAAGVPRCVRRHRSYTRTRPAS